MEKKSQMNKYIKKWALQFASWLNAFGLERYAQGLRFESHIFYFKLSFNRFFLILNCAQELIIIYL